MERLRVLYMGRETIPDIREAVFTNREKRSSPLITLNSIRIIQEEVHFWILIYSQAGLGVQDPEPLHCETQPRPRGWRPQRPLCFQMFFSRSTSTTSFALPPASKRWSFLGTKSLLHTSGRSRTGRRLSQAWCRSRRRTSTWFEVSLQRFWIGSTRSSSIGHYHSHFLLLLVFMLMLLLIAHSQSSRDTFCEGVLVFMLMLVFMLILMLVFMFMLVLMLVL